MERDTTKFDIVFTLGRSSQKICVWLLLGPYASVGFPGANLELTCRLHAVRLTRCIQVYRSQGICFPGISTETDIRVRGQGPISVRNIHLNGDIMFAKCWKILKLGTNKLKLDFELLPKIFFRRNNIHREIDHWNRRRFDAKWHVTVPNSVARVKPIVC